MVDVQWRSLPCVYSDSLSSAALIAARLPFNIGIIDVHADRPMSMHWHDAFELGYVVSGSGIFVIEERELSFMPGQVHVINNIQRHMAYAFDHARFFNVHFHPDLLADLSFPMLTAAAQLPFSASTHRFAAQLPAEDPHTASIRALLQAVAEEHRAAAPHWPLAVKGLILQIVALLLRHFVAAGPPDARARRHQENAARLAPVLALLERRLLDPPTRREMACAANLSPSRFNALFRETMGVSPVAYRNSRRIAQAQRLLASGEGPPISHVAEQCGFATVQQFNRIFRHVVGCAPGVYRARAGPAIRGAEQFHVLPPAT